MESVVTSVSDLEICDQQSTTSNDNSADGSNERRSRIPVPSRIPRPRTSGIPTPVGYTASMGSSSHGSLASDDMPVFGRPASLDYRDNSDSSSYGTSNGRTTPLSPTSSAASGPRAPIQSKIKSFSNFNHTPGGGKVKVYHKKIDVKDVSSKCGSRKNMKHQAGGGNVQIFDDKPKFKEIAASKVGSMKNAKHVAGGGDIKIETQKLNWDAGSRVGSWKNAKHKPGGGDLKIETLDLNWETKSRVGSWQNVKHKPGGGNVKIVDESLNWDVGARTVHKLGQKQPTQLRVYGASPRLDSGSGSDDSPNGNSNGNEAYLASPTPTDEIAPVGRPIETDLDAPGP